MYSRYTVDRTERIGNRYMVLACGNSVVCVGVYIVKICSQRNYIVIEIRTVRRGCVIVRFYLIVVVYRSVVLFGFDFVISFIEHGCFRPVTVKSKERSVERDFAVVYGFKRYETFYVHSVREQGVYHRLFRVRKFIRHRNRKRSVCVYRYGFARKASVAGCGCRVVVVKQLISFGNVLFVRFRNGFRHSDNAEIIRNRGIGNVYHVELQGVNARSFRVVFKFYLRLFFAVYRQIRFRFGYGGNACEPRALFSRRIRVTLFVYRDGSRRHKHLIAHNGYLFVRIRRELFF